VGRDRHRPQSSTTPRVAIAAIIAAPLWQLAKWALGQSSSGGAPVFGVASQQSFGPEWARGPTGHGRSRTRHARYVFGADLFSSRDNIRQSSLVLRPLNRTGKRRPSRNCRRVRNSKSSPRQGHLPARHRIGPHRSSVSAKPARESSHIGLPGKYEFIKPASAGGAVASPRGSRRRRRDQQVGKPSLPRTPANWRSERWDRRHARLGFAKPRFTKEKQRHRLDAGWTRRELMK